MTTRYDRMRAAADRAVCLFSGHRYYVLQVFSQTVRRVQCTRCGGDWGMNDRVPALVEWDSELEEMQRMFGFRIRRPKFSDGSPLTWPSADRIRGEK